MGSKGIKVVLEGYEYSDQEKSLEIEFPLYLQCYKEAMTAILNGITKNREIRGDGKKWKNIYSGSGQDPAYPEVYNNIVAFMGGRGSGKTTAVTEFCKVLYRYHKKWKEWETVLPGQICFDGGRPVRFHVLSPIDASVLSEKEDLMEIIFAGMYQAFCEKMEDDKNAWLKKINVQELVSEFDTVYKGYLNIGKREEQQILGDSVIVKLKNASNSLKLQLSIEKLVKHFLALLEEGAADESSYLVIAIDDLDMTLESGYEMLDQLQSYWANSKVIILISIKYEQMKRICDKHFVDCLIPKFGGVHKEIYDKFERKAQRLSNDYLMKVMPFSNRIYMPEHNLLDNARILDKSESCDRGESVKKYILNKVAAKMYIFYDAKGVKKHFCLPDTIREFVLYNEFLDTLFSVEEIQKSNDRDLKNPMDLYDQNHERFNQDIEQRMAVQILDDGQLELYRMIMKQDIERRPKYAIGFLRARLLARKDFAGEAGRFVDRADGRRYSYADLLKILYDLGRADYRDKTLVHCILASFTSEMVREYYSYKNNTDQEARNRAENRLRCFLGDTFGGQWFEEVMPKVVLPDNPNRQFAVGYISKIGIIDWKVKLSGILVLNEENKIEGYDRVMGLLVEALPYMECLSMFFSKDKNASDKLGLSEWGLNLCQGVSEDGKIIELTVTNRADNQIFDIFGFIGKEMGILEKMRKELHDELKRCFACFLKEEMNVSQEQCDRQIERLEEKMMSNSVLVEEIENSRNGKIVFPFYNLDMSYNIMKRVRSNIKENRTIGRDGIYNYFRTVYKYMAQELEAEEEYYQDEALLVEDWYGNFMNSPFVRKFMEEDEDKEDKSNSFDPRIFNGIFEKALVGFRLDENLAIQEHEINV